MNTNSENPKVGKEFQKRVLNIAMEWFQQSFIEERAVPIGKPAKDHKFDVVSIDGKRVIECKYYSWTNGNNVPSAKMATLNEAVLYMRNLPDDVHKILVMKKDVRVSNGETLAQYYVRINGHLLADIEVWEVDENNQVEVVRASVVV